MSEFIDRFKKLLIKQEFETGNLNETDYRIVLASAGLMIPADTQLTEREVTDSLIRWSETIGSNVHADAVEIRRYLVDARCLERDAAGRTYVRSSRWPATFHDIAAELGALDLEPFAEQVRNEEADRRAARKKAALEKNRNDAGIN